MVAGLAQLGKFDEAQTALAELRQMDANLDSAAAVLRRVYPDPAAVEHILDGLRKAGFQ